MIWALTLSLRARTHVFVSWLGPELPGEHREDRLPDPAALGRSIIIIIIIINIIIIIIITVIIILFSTWISRASIFSPVVSNCDSMDWRRSSEADNRSLAD